MKYLILENESEISERLKGYLEAQRHKQKVEAVILGMADHRASEEIAEQFTKCQVLLFEPTILTFSQYNLMMMLMYDLMKKGTLTIKEIQIFDEPKVEEDLKELWEGKRMYLNLILEKVTIYSVGKLSYEKTKLEI